MLFILYSIENSETSIPTSLDKRRIIKQFVFVFTFGLDQNINVNINIKSWSSDSKSHYLFI